MVLKENKSIVVTWMRSERVEVLGVDATSGYVGMSPKERKLGKGSPLWSHGETVFGQVLQQIVEFTKQLIDIAPENIRVLRPYDLRKGVTKRR